jgi:hypothetical protein
VLKNTTNIECKKLLLKHSVSKTALHILALLRPSSKTHVIKGDYLAAHLKLYLKVLEMITYTFLFVCTKM